MVELEAAMDNTLEAVDLAVVAVVETMAAEAAEDTPVVAAAHQTAGAGAVAEASILAPTKPIPPDSKPATDKLFLLGN
jgi:hypothetical protein